MTNDFVLQPTEYDDTHVHEGKQYEYRVSAVNTAGSGVPSEPSDVYTAKLTREKPKLHLEGLIGGRIKVRAGEPINISIPISGAPTPRIEWTINNQKPPETNRILVSVEIYTRIRYAMSVINIF